TGGSGVMIYLITELFHNAYSREKEQEADAFAVKAMQQKGYSLSGIAQFFSRSVRVDGLAIMDNMPWLSTHPANEARIKFFNQHGQNKPGNIPVLTEDQWFALRTLKGCG